MKSVDTCCLRLGLNPGPGSHIPVWKPQRCHALTNWAVTDKIRILNCSKHSHGSCGTKSIHDASYCWTSYQFVSVPVGSLYVTFVSIDLIHKSQNAPVPYHTMLQSVEKCAHFCSEWRIVGYGTRAFWEFWIRCIPNVSYHSGRHW